jgi:hypothetical protein
MAWHGRLGKVRRGTDGPGEIRQSTADVARYVAAGQRQVGHGLARQTWRGMVCEARLGKARSG